MGLDWDRTRARAGSLTSGYAASYAVSPSITQGNLTEAIFRDVGCGKWPAKHPFLIYSAASVVELVDTPDLGSGAVRCGGSSPSARTKNCGNSSVVEHFLAKEGVAGSSPVSRSKVL